MLISNLEYLTLFVITFVIVGFLTPVMRSIALKNKILDLPNLKHKSHVTPIPYLGGVAIIIGVITVSYLTLIFSDFSLSYFLLATSVLAPAFAMGMVGLWDDLTNLPPLPRFFAQTIAGIVVAACLVLSDNIGNPTGSTIVDISLTVLWVVGICNSINFFDNLDGGAAGTAAISSIFLTYISIQSSQTFVAALSIVVAGATLGFLIWNKVPARIYMGDAGALFLGVLLATLTVRLKPNTETTVASLFTPVLLLSIPILDTTVAVISRLRRRASPFEGGRDHLSHRLVRAGLSRKITVLLLWSLSVIFGLFAIIINSVNKNSELFFIILSLLIWAILFIGFLKTSDT